MNAHGIKENPPILIYTSGICYTSVCVEKDADRANIETYVNLHLPTGISSKWKISTDQSFAEGAPNPSPCPDVEGREHVLLDC